jgi:hypothetical protein
LHPSVRLLEQHLRPPELGVLGGAMHLIPDGYDYADPELIRDPAKHLGLWWLLA